MFSNQLAAWTWTLTSFIKKILKLQHYSNLELVKQVTYYVTMEHPSSNLTYTIVCSLPSDINNVSLKVIVQSVATYLATFCCNISMAARKLQHLRVGQLFNQSSCFFNSSINMILHLGVKSDLSCKLQQDLNLYNYHYTQQCQLTLKLPLMNKKQNTKNTDAYLASTEVLAR